jgi:hypothetical protein
LEDVLGNAVRVAGAGRMASPAQDAACVLDGVRTVLTANILALQGGSVRLTLHSARPDEEVSLGIGPDRQAVTASIQTLASAVSVLARTITENVASLSRNFVNDFSATIQAQRIGLARIAVDVNDDNSMTFDPETFADIFDADPSLVETIVASPHGAAQRIGQFATEVMSAPISRFGAPDLIPAMLPPTSHPTPQMLLASNSLSALLYAQLFAQGLFINTLF